MALTESTMLSLGTPAPDFQLPDPTGRVYQLRDVAEAKALLVMFICNHCPYVIHLKPALAAFARQWQPQGLGVIAINANDSDAYPADNAETMAHDSAQFDYPFPYLIDADQQIAKAYRAACTPDFFLFDAQRLLSYRGQFDASRPGSGLAANGEDLATAVAATLQGQPVPGPHRPSLGCNIKWRPGNAPEYAQ